ncbi:MAG: serine protease [Lysobacterales bacterium 69-70]|nr:patatin-like phospholipase family protein [Xanthomonadaceae bacterium]ODU35887.1 MAG: serine protease [Xanthomonadaceae bacterium SCN 69-320]ODV18390.1 MAG: serine protease [Xanthomonadaceae bacterium SCN 69-25]OJY97371.1 MAG: serine protease [Xanthomonadales bacterium 69-70]
MNLPAHPAEPPRRGAISLVLGSGGARGYAHVGVIEELRAHGYEIRSVAGSSMGALVGGVYAAGKLSEYRDWAVGLKTFDVLRLVDWSWRGGGLIKGQRVIGALRDLVGEMNIEDLPISYTAVAVDIDAQREVWFSRGSLFDAIRASISIPTVFRPHHYQGRRLVDGGLLNPVPVTPTLRDLTDATIAVDVNAEAEGVAERETPITRPEIHEPDEENRPTGLGRIGELWERFLENRSKRASIHEPGVLDLFARSLDVVQETLTRYKLAAQPPDLVISIPRNVCAFYEFQRAAEVIEIGRQRTREALARWQRIRRPQVWP